MQVDFAFRLPEFPIIGNMDGWLILRRKWSKKKIIQMYNDSKNPEQIGVKYSERSLSIKHFATIFADIVKLVELSQ